ncbi:MAG: prolipoprotein diacylglyceryl transferase [Bacteroidota bacterium]|nr:prolipoprotein diacylglyceryl transferase [Bacteroidota bacterium]
MYPTLYHALLDLTGIDLPFLKFLNSFGFFVALAFILASWTLGLELKRKEKEGLLRAVKRTVIEGASATPVELVISGIIGFIFGWKVIHLLLNFSASASDPQQFLLSTTGNIPGGLAVAALFIWLKWREKKKQLLAEPKRTEVAMMPHEHAGNVTLTAAIWGLIGAKLFHWLENPDEFMQFIRNPGPGSLFSGLTMYGGLIFAGAMVIRYFVRHGIPAMHGADSAAPGVMLAYGVGRMGCHVAGDGDWGIVNNSASPSWMPHWLWSYTYPNNVNAVGIPITEGTCFPGYCTVLPEPVFPTPLYELMACLLLFGLLWAYRKQARPAGMIFFSFLILNGIERFFIEKIRVNVRVFGDITQAEIIAVLLVLAGVAGILWIRNKTPRTDGPIATDH